MRLTDRTVTNSKPELPEGKTDAIFFDDAISGLRPARPRRRIKGVDISTQPRRAYQADDAWPDVEDRRGQSQSAVETRNFGFRFLTFIKFGVPKRELL